MNPSVLDVVDVKKPCSASWDEMRGDDLSRFCLHCSKHVYDLSRLTRSEAEALILEKEGRLCARYYRRRDGRVLTKDCSAPLVLRRPAVLSALVAFLAMICLLVFRIIAGPADRGNFLRTVEPFRTVMEWISPAPFVMGDFCAPPPPANPVPAAPAEEEDFDWE